MTASAYMAVQISSQNNQGSHAHTSLHQLTRGVNRPCFWTPQRGLGISPRSFFVCPLHAGSNQARLQMPSSSFPIPALTITELSILASQRHHITVQCRPGNEAKETHNICIIVAPHYSEIQFWHHSGTTLQCRLE